MSKHKDIPMNAIPIRTYEELYEMVGKFAQGHFNLLGIVSTQGTGKSETVRRAMRSVPHLLIKGNARAFILYQQAFFHRDDPIVIDDADTVFADKNCNPLLKSLCETTERKTVMWMSRAIDDENIPRQFTTRSRVIILANEWKTLTANTMAIAGRGIFIHFCPSAKEVHREVGRLGWLNDDEVYEDAIGKHLHIITVPSMRYYFHAKELKMAGIRDWKDKVLRMLNPNLDNRALEIVSKLLADDTIANETERCKRFIELSKLSQRTYYRYANMLEDAECDLEPVAK